MNNNTTDLSAGGIFSYSYSASTRTVEFKVKEGLNYKLKIPTDAELKNYVNNTWNTTQSNYDSSNPLSINYLLSNYISEQLGGIINDTSAPLSEDYISVGGKNLKRLSFRITDDKSNTLNLYDIPCQFSLIFSHPSY